MVLECGIPAEFLMTALIAKKVSLVTPAPKSLPQLVPSSACFSCEICCRFPDPDSVLRPYFTGEEIARAVEHGLAADFDEALSDAVTQLEDAGAHTESALQVQMIGTASMNDMKTPIKTQNSIEMATAEMAVTATITASKRDADTW